MYATSLNEDCALATIVTIDPKLIERAMAVSGVRSKRAVVSQALNEFIARRQQKRLLDLMDRLEWDAGYDHKKGRERR